MKKITALDISKYFVEIASKIDENDLTNLKLQKLLYFAQKEFFDKTGKLLFGDQIEAWNFGSVVRSVYDTFKRCGAFPITSFDIEYKAEELDKEIKSFIDGIWEEYGKFSANYLVSLTHKKGSPWNVAYNSENKVIDLEKTN